MELDTRILNPMLSPDGKYLVYFTDDDSLKIECVDVVAGKKAWTRPLKDFNRYYISRFLGNDTMLVGDENRHLFLDVSDGATIATLPIIGASWDDMLWYNSAGREYDTVKPWIRDSLAIYYFREGMQIIDLKKAAVIYQTTDAPSKVKYYFWKHYLMINPVSGGDTIYVIDYRNNKLVYKRATKDREPNSSLYQPFAINNSRLLTFDEDDIQCLDLTTGAVKSVIPVDPDDPELYSPVIFKSGLYLLVSDEGLQTLYNTEDGSVLCRTKPGRVPGVVDQVVELPNNEAILMAYDADNTMTIHKINMTSGDVIWSKPFFVQESPYRSGHKQGSKVLGEIAALTPGSSPGFSDRRSSGWYKPIHERTLIEQWEVERENKEYKQEMAKRVQRSNEAYNQWVNLKKESSGYAAILESDSNRMSVVAAGEIYAAGTADTAREFNGEGIFTISIADGSTISSTRCVMLANRESSQRNAVVDLNIQQLDSARVLVGSTDLYVVRTSNIEHFGFGEETISFINSSRSSVTIRTNHSNDWYDCWRIDVSTTPARKYLIARSPSPNIVFHDTASCSTTLRIAGDSIEAFPLISGDVSDASFSSRKWIVTEEELDSHAIGYLEHDARLNSHLRGIWIDGGDVYLMGSMRIGYVSSDGSCRWSHEWSPDSATTRMGLTRVGSSLVYSTGGRSAVIKQACPMKVVAKVKIPFMYSFFVVSKETNAVIVDLYDNTIESYPVK